MLDAALRYRKRGFSVIPCKKDKKPLVKWESYQLQKPTETEIREWWEKWPNANVAIPCGHVSGVDVLDVDTEEAYQQLQDNYLSDSFRTPTVKTPNGRHLYFKHRVGLSNAVRIVPGTDLRTVGGYVIAPPSRNGEGTPYHWLEGLSPKDCEFSEWPDELFVVLQAGGQSSFNIYNNNAKVLYKGRDDNPESECRQMSSLSSNVSNLFEQGTRDQDIFHVAYCLAKGGYEKDKLQKTLEIIADGCNPPFDKKEIFSKIESAFKRKNSRERNLTDEVRDFVLSSTGVFLSSNVVKCLQVSSREEQKNVSKILSRLKVDGIIEKSGNRDGEWRLIDQDCKPMDWINSSCEYKELSLPLGLGDICGVQPGNILLFAGAKDSGKTAFLLNIAKENRKNYKIHYFNSEMGPAEFKLRVSKFEDFHPSQWKDVSVYERSDNFADVIKPGIENLNIIDFLEVVDEFWKVASAIQKIHKKLGGALCVIGLQKNPGADLGRGGAFSLEKARLYISLDYQSAKIVSCKNFKENELIKGNPRGYTTKYKLVNGCMIKKDFSGWTSPLTEEKE
jgi:hypothetical protein